jgi:hypothetical protein
VAFSEGNLGAFVVVCQAELNLMMLLGVSRSFGLKAVSSKGGGCRDRARGLALAGRAEDRGGFDVVKSLK